MITRPSLIGAFAVLSSVFSCLAAVRYVDVNSATPTPPYSTWATAAAVIQDAVDAAEAGDEIIVTNGIYATGGRVVYGSLTNRVAVNKPVTLRSVNGWQFTEIQGYQTTFTGDGGIRCVYLTNGACLSGFTLRGGAVRNKGDTVWEQCGGGVWCESDKAVVTNCTLTSNWAYDCGGGAYSGTLTHCRLTDNFCGRGAGAYLGTLSSCLLTGNSGGYGAGAHSSTLNNCTLIGNSGGFGTGGLHSGTASNCIIYYNTSQVNSDPNYAGGTLNYCCTTPLPASGVGNISLEPLLSDAVHLSAGSPCRGAAFPAVAAGVDIDGDVWANPPSIGCDEYSTGPMKGLLSVSLSITPTNPAAGSAAKLQALFEGNASASAWDFGDGVVVSNRPFAIHTWSVPGSYAVTLRAWNDSYPAGVAATGTVWVEPAIYYVSVSSTSPASPYASWATAATNIQDAVDAAAPGALVLVSNGLYATGGRVVWNSLTNRLVVDKPVTVRSVNGPQVTVIQGYQVPGTTNGEAAVRCVRLSGDAVLSGFTITNGATRTSLSNITMSSEWDGGGVYSDAGEVVTNCVITGNAAGNGGGVRNAHLYDCTVTDNWAKYRGGGAYYGSMSNCVVRGNRSGWDGGGLYWVTLHNSQVVGNTSAGNGGGAYMDVLVNSTFASNSASSGGGVYGSTVQNCTIVGNSAKTSGGGTATGTLSNSVIYYNRVLGTTGTNHYSASLHFCCSTPMPAGVANITNAPQFVDYAGGNFRLQSNSPCINAGTNIAVSVSTDLDGRPRIVGGRVDMGAYEYQGSGMSEFIGWLQKSGLPTDGAADFTDMDLDGQNNWQEWRADTSPTDAVSKLALLAPTNTPTGLAVTWESVPTRSYFVERGTDLAQVPMMLTLATNISGQPGRTTFTDTTATNGGPFFYRVGIRD